MLDQQRVPSSRVYADGKHLALDGSPYRVKGVTYGGFLRRLDGQPFPEPHQIKADLDAIAEAGLNTVRTYDVPPVDMLEIAAECDLRLIVGLQYPDWRQHEATGRRVRRAVRAAGRAAVQCALERCAGRAEVLALSVGNEVPGDLVRLHGPRTVADVLTELVAEVHRGDPELLATYPNYPTTEYLQVEGQDFVSFNVFLEQPAAFRAYLMHLQRVAGERPVVLTELGLAAELHGEDGQARALAWQLDAVDTAGCAGAAIFSWTDEWGVAGQPVSGWGFGLTRCDRTPKPAYAVARCWARQSVRDLRQTWPSLTVVVCAYNEGHLLAECLDSLLRLDYPQLQVIVCDDGSTDETALVAREYPFEILTLRHGGLSAARNAGIAAASGENVAFLDADASCHPDWPYHLALSLEDTGVAAAGGPNLPVSGAPLVEQAVALSPGGPVEVLLTDTRAEHVPGCNMAFRRTAIEAIGGFNPAYTSAGDDVDVCWRLLASGREIAFAPAAQVIHHRRDTVRGYLRQQRGYGRAERMLSGPHAHRFNRLGSARWCGSVYGGPRVLPRLLRPVIYHGSMGSAPYQTVLRDRSPWLLAWASALLPLVAVLGVLSGLVGIVWHELYVVPVVAAVALLGYAVAVAAAVRLPAGAARQTALRCLVAALHLLQPFARTWGRLCGRPLPGVERRKTSWTGVREDWLRALHRDLSASWLAVRVPPPDRSWDLETRVGVLVTCRIRTALRWGWFPLARRSCVPTRFGVAAAALAVALLAKGVAAAGLALTVLFAAAVAEGIVLRVATARALRRTTVGVSAQ